MLGIDMVNVERIESAIKRRERFLYRVFSPEEIEEVKNRKKFYEALAGKFACKEAVIKALGGGLSPKISLSCIERMAPHILSSATGLEKSLKVLW